MLDGPPSRPRENSQSGIGLERMGMSDGAKQRSVVDAVRVGMAQREVHRRVLRVTASRGELAETPDEVPVDTAREREPGTPVGCSALD